jgi:hypothetical protein
MRRLMYSPRLPLCSGALILGGIFCYSRISAINAVWGSVVSTLVAYVLPSILNCSNHNHAGRQCGLWVAAGRDHQRSVQLHWRADCHMSLRIVLCGDRDHLHQCRLRRCGKLPPNNVFVLTQRLQFHVIVAVFLRVVFGLIGIPPIALPFTLVTWFFLGMQGVPFCSQYCGLHLIILGCCPGSIQGAPPVELTEISTPERHFKLHWKRKHGRNGTSSMFIKNTGLDPAELL